MDNRNIGNTEQKSIEVTTIYNEKDNILSRMLPKLYDEMIYVVIFHYFLTDKLNCNINELRHEKTNILISDRVRHRPGFTAT